MEVRPRLRLNPLGERTVLVTCVAAVLVLALATPAAALPPDWQKGANVTAWWHDGYEGAKVERSLAGLRATGTTQAAFVTTWYMTGATDSAIAPDADRTPSDTGLLHAIGFAHQLGMTVTLKPHVDVRDGSFRGDIAPSDPGRWFADYGAMIDHYAALAQDAGADMLVVGTELTSMSSFADDWRGVIADARSRFTGRLTFAANWTDGAQRVPFWAELDYIGIDAYMPLVQGSGDPSSDVLASAWCQTDAAGTPRSYVDEAKALHDLYGKPVIFTELGYESRLGATATPWGGASGEISQHSQQQAFEAAYRVWSRLPWFKGIYWWNWPSDIDSATSDDGSYAFYGKAAQETVGAWNAAGTPAGYGSDPCSPPPPPPPPAQPTRTVITLSAHVRRKHRERHRARLAGRVRRDGRGCGGKVVVRLERWSRSRHRWSPRRSVRAHALSVGRYRVMPRKLRSGRYRARAHAARRCGEAKSRFAHFRV
jgi:hypothetical protein